MKRPEKKEVQKEYEKNLLHQLYTLYFYISGYI